MKVVGDSNVGGHGSESKLVYYGRYHVHRLSHSDIHDKYFVRELEPPFTKWKNDVSQCNDVSINGFLNLTISDSRASSEPDRTTA